MDARDYEILYDLPAGAYDRQAVGGIRTRTTRAGDALVVECYPITRIEAPARAEKQRRRSTAAQIRLNQRRSEQRVRMLIEANFTGADWVVTLTWDYGFLRDADRMSREELLRNWQELQIPEEEADARRAFGNWIKRVKYHMARDGQDPAELKYLYVLESTHEPRDTDPRPLPPHFHVHAVVHAPGLPREALKSLWPHGFVRADELSLRDEGAARLARYLTKREGKTGRPRPGRLRRWAGSRNLKEPAVTVSDRTLSRRRAAAVAADVMQYGREIFERLYPEYRCVELPVVRFSDFVAGAYIYAAMRRRR